MTSEQEEAVERLEKRIKDNEDYKTTQVWLTDDVSAVYTVLNMIKKKDKSIEIQKDNYKNLTEDISKIAKELGLEEDGTIDEIFAEIEKKDKRTNDLEYALLDMVMQFADRQNIKGSNYAINTMGLSALELAFNVLGFDDPYPVKKAEEKYKILAKQYFERKLNSSGQN